MRKSKSENYWEMESKKYPLQIKVVHMSEEDVDPRKFNVLAGWPAFLRVPFDGYAHWGFKDQKTLEKFKNVAGIL